ncbi:MAG TPA: cytochrome c biogenesis heme-transporting ATPase CcmA [Burkholderiales bacterium]|jgi:heme exporter protein A|nr:cytochrome c biogenesis heme-transporting ATPase CcmA [Burkholderiales bacterium]
MLEATQIECVRGSRRLFRDLSFRLEAHQALRVRGGNGSGKTSLLRIVAGLSPAESGSITWNQDNIRALGEDYLRDLLFLGHSNGLKDDLSPVENLRYALALAGSDADEPVLRGALAEQGLAAVADLPAKLLSQGQKRRAALARLSFSSQKLLWILDEPFTALDAASVERLARTITTQLQAGGMVMFTTHQEVELPGTARTLELGAD